MRIPLYDIWCGLGKYRDTTITRAELVRSAGAQAAAWALAAAGCHSRADRPGDPGRQGEYTCLAYNESPLGPSGFVLDAVRKAVNRPLDVAGINRYPDIFSLDLLGAISRHNGLGPLQVVTGCGSSEIINIAAAAFLREGDECILGTPTFDLPADRARAWGATVRRVPLTKDHHYDLEGILDAAGPRTRLVYICNPNNPTGTILGADEVDAFLGRLRRICPDAVVLFDEAYREYVTDPDFPDLPGLLAGPFGEKVVVARSFSKAYGIAGLRAGYGLAGRKTAYEMSGFFTGNFGGPLGWRHPEGNINRIAEAAVLASLDDSTGHMARVLALNREAKEYLYDIFDRLGLAFIRSEANFVMVDTARDSVAVREALCARGILVQAGAAYHPDYADYLRVSTGTMAQMETFAQALMDVLDETAGQGSGRCPKTDYYGY